MSTEITPVARRTRTKAPSTAITVGTWEQSPTETWEIKQDTVVKRYSVWADEDLPTMGADIDYRESLGYSHSVYAIGAEYIVVVYQWRDVVRALPEEPDENA